MNKYYGKEKFFDKIKNSERDFVDLEKLIGYEFIDRGHLKKSEEYKIIRIAMFSEAPYFPNRYVAIVKYKGEESYYRVNLSDVLKDKRIKKST